MNKTAITCAVTGAETTRTDNPHLSLSPEEIASESYDAILAGASILHLHVRDDKGTPTQDAVVFKSAIELIRKKCDIVIEVTTGGAVGMTLEERLQPLQLKPEMASLDCGTCNFGDKYIVNTLSMIREAATLMKEYRIRPTLECFDLSHIDTSRIIISEGLVEPPFHYGFVLNVPGGIKYSAETLDIFVRRTPENSYWAALGIGGKANMDAIFGAIAHQGFIRVGFEDNIYFSRGELAESNAQLVERATGIARNAGCLIASAADVRKMFQLQN